MKEEVLFLIKNIEEHTTNKGNDCLKVHGYSTSENRSYTLWVFNDDWIEELKIREDEYLNNEFEVLIDDKTGGSRNHVWGIYFWPTDVNLQEDWFDSYLNSRGIDKTKPSEEEVKRQLEKVNEFMSEDNVAETSDEDSVKSGDYTDRNNADRNTRIERQASMHFASRIVSGMMQSSKRETVWTDEEIEEELNKWMTKFQRGVATGKVQ